MGNRLLEIASIALQARQAVFEETGFTITMGVSFNPLMAKLASGLRKPGKVNLLQPSSSSRLLVESMPLRKIPGIGSRTMKVLVPCLVDRYGSKGDTASPWTCRCETRKQRRWYFCHLKTYTASILLCAHSQGSTPNPSQ